MAEVDVCEPVHSAFCGMEQRMCDMLTVLIASKAIVNEWTVERIVDMAVTNDAFKAFVADFTDRIYDVRGAADPSVVAGALLNHRALIAFAVCRGLERLVEKRVLSKTEMGVYSVVL